MEPQAQAISRRISLRQRVLANWRYRKAVRREARLLVARLGLEGALRETRNVLEATENPDIATFAYNVECEVRVIAFHAKDFELDIPDLLSSVVRFGREEHERVRLEWAEDPAAAAAAIRSRFHQSLLSPGAPLTDRQMECLEWVAQGKSSSDIAGILGLSKRTVDEHLAAVCEKLGVKTRVQAVGKLEKINSLDADP